MGKKKKQKVAKDETEAWCYYCDRVFEHEEVLILHQKTKHFSCMFCKKKLSTAGGLVVHAQQVHRETISEVPNAKEGRKSVDLEIYGINGIPAEAWAERAAKKARIAGTNGSDGAAAAAAAATPETPKAETAAPGQQPAIPGQGMPPQFNGHQPMPGMMFPGGAPGPGMGFHPMGQPGFHPGMMGPPRPGFNPMQHGGPPPMHGGPNMPPHMFGGPRGPNGQMLGGPMQGGFPRGPPPAPPGPPPRGLPPGLQPGRGAPPNGAPPGAPPVGPRGAVPPLFPAGAAAAAAAAATAQQPVAVGSTLTRAPTHGAPGGPPNASSGLPGQAQSMPAVVGDEEFSMEEKRAELAAYKV
ncbi:unnamed protein product [Ectocarpus sp. 6 AP-2014]